MIAAVTTRPASLPSAPAWFAFAAGLAATFDGVGDTVGVTTSSAAVTGLAVLRTAGVTRGAGLYVARGTRLRRGVGLAVGRRGGGGVVTTGAGDDGLGLGEKTGGRKGVGDGDDGSGEGVGVSPSAAPGLRTRSGRMISASDAISAASRTRDIARCYGGLS